MVLLYKEKIKPNQTKKIKRKSKINSLFRRNQHRVFYPSKSIHFPGSIIRCIDRPKESLKTHKLLFRKRIKMNQTKKIKQKSRRKKYKYSGGIQATNQGDYGICYAEALTRCILKLLKNTKLIGDIRDIEKTELKKLDEFENAYINTNVAYRSKVEQVNEAKKSIDEYEYMDKEYTNIIELFKEIFNNLTEIYKNKNNIINEIRYDFIELCNSIVKKIEQGDKISNDEVIKTAITEDIIKYMKNIKNIKNIKKITDETEQNKIIKLKNALDNLLSTINNHSYKYNEFVEFKKKLVEEIKRLVEEKKNILLKRTEFVNNNEKIKNIITEQNEYYNLINNFIISKIGMEGGDTYLLSVWFANYINDETNFIKEGEESEEGKNILKNVTRSDIYKNNDNNPPANSSCKTYDINENEDRTYKEVCEIDYDKLYNIFLRLHSKLKNENNKIKIEQINNEHSNLNINKIIDILKTNIYIIISSDISNEQFKQEFFNNPTKINDHENIDYCNRNGSNKGHAYNIVGYNETTKQFTIKNSWGVDWGDFGKINISSDKLQNLCIYSLYSLVIEQK